MNNDLMNTDADRLEVARHMDVISVSVELQSIDKPVSGLDPEMIDRLNHAESFHRDHPFPSPNFDSASGAIGEVVSDLQQRTEDLADIDAMP